MENGVAAQQDDVRLVTELVSKYEQWQADPRRQRSESAARLLEIVQAVRKLCVPGTSIDEHAVAALRGATGLDFRVEGDAVLFELADDNNPGKTQTVSVRAADAGIG